MDLFYGVKDIIQLEGRGQAQRIVDDLRLALKGINE
jgi:hypothetical protein